MNLMLFVSACFILLMAFAFSLIPLGTFSTIIDTTLFTGILWLVGLGVFVWGIKAKSSG